MRILITDDNDQLREVLADYLTYEGFNVITAKNGHEGSVILQNYSIDLVITDVIMPEKDGVEMIREARQICPDLKVIAISGGNSINEIDYLDTVRLLGAVRTFTKPIDIVELTDAVHQLAADCELTGKN